MAIQPMALSVANTQGNALGAFAQGQEHAQTQRANNLSLYQQTLQNVGSLAFGVLGGKLDGQADPALWEEALDMIGTQGVNVDQFRGRPDLAPVIAKASADTLGQLSLAQNERELEQRMQEFDFAVSQALKGPAPTAEMRNYEWANGDPSRQAFLGMGTAAGARPLTPEERQQWGIPATDTRPYSIVPGKPPEPVGGSGGQTINVNTAGSGDSEFFKGLDAADGEVFANLIKEAPTLGRKAIQIDQLEGLLNNFSSGGGAAIQQLAGEWGINTEGLDTIQAAQALINQIVPEQRQPGSGPMSDADLALFKQSVPRIISQPGGNQMIIDTMRGINDYTRGQADIAAKLAARQITRDEAREELANLPNPLEGYAERVKGSQTGGVAKPTSQEDYDALPSGAIFIDPDDGQTYRKP